MNIQKIHDQLDIIQKQPRSKEAWEAFTNLLQETTIQDALKTTPEQSLTDIINRILAIKKLSSKSFGKYVGTFNEVKNDEDVKKFVEDIKDNPSRFEHELFLSISREKLKNDRSRFGQIKNALSKNKKPTPPVEEKPSADKAEAEVIDKSVTQGNEEPLSDYEEIKEETPEELARITDQINSMALGALRHASFSSNDPRVETLQKERITYLEKHIGEIRKKESRDDLDRYISQNNFNETTDREIQQDIQQYKQILGAIAKIKTMETIEEVEKASFDSRDFRIDQAKEDQIKYLKNEQAIKKLIEEIKDMKTIEEVAAAGTDSKDRRIDTAKRERTALLTDEKNCKMTQDHVYHALEKEEVILYSQVAERYRKEIVKNKKMNKQEKNTLMRYLTDMEEKKNIQLSHRGLAIWKDQQIMRGTAHPEYITEIELNDEHLKALRDNLMIELKNKKEVKIKDYWEKTKKDILINQKLRIKGKQDKIPNEIIALLKEIEDEGYIIDYGTTYKQGWKLLAENPEKIDTHHSSYAFVEALDTNEKLVGMAAWHAIKDIYTNIAEKDKNNELIKQIHEKTTLESRNPYEAKENCKKFQQTVPKYLTDWIESLEGGFIASSLRYLENGQSNEATSKIEELIAGLINTYQGKTLTETQAREYLKKAYKKNVLPTDVQRLTIINLKQLFAKNYTTWKKDDVDDVVYKQIMKDLEKHLQDNGLFLNEADNQGKKYELLEYVLSKDTPDMQKKVQQKGLPAYRDVYKAFKNIGDKDADISKKAKEYKDQFEKTSFEQKNPYLLINQLMELKEPIPASLWSWTKRLEKTFLTTMRDEEVVAKQETIKTHLLEKFGGDSMEETLATTYINEHYKKNNLPKTYETLIKTRLLEKFKETLLKDEQGTLRTEADFLQKAEDDVRTACMKYGLCMIAEPRTLNEGKLDDSKHSPLDAKDQFAQALELKKLAHCQKEFLEEQEDTGLHLNSAQKKPKEYALTHGSWFKNVVGSVKRFLVDFFSIDTPTAKEKKYPDTLPKKYLQACPKTPYKRTCPNNGGEVFVDGFAGTITHKYVGYNPITVGINREKPEETMQQLASSTAFGGEPISKYVLQALIQAYAEKLIDNDGPQKFTNMLGEECIIRMGISGSVSIEKNGSRMAPLSEGHNAENYQQLLEYRSHIKSAIEQYVPLEEEVDEEVHGSITGITNTTPVSSAYMAKNGILPAGNFSITVSNDILVREKQERTEKDGEKKSIPAKYRTANTINIDSRYSLASLNSSTSHVFTGETGRFAFGSDMFIKFPTKVVKVEKIDSIEQGTDTIDRYEVLEEYESLEKLNGEININKYFDQELKHMIASDAEPFTQMQPLVSFIIPVNNTTDPSQIFYYNPLTDERFKGQDQDGHPGVSAVDLGDFADDIYAGSTEKRGKNLAVSVKAFATNKKGALDADNNFVWESTGKNINTVQKAPLPKDQLPKVLQSTQAKKAIDSATKKLLSSLG